jgi:hypothetical protein
LTWLTPCHTRATWCGVRSGLPAMSLGKDRDKLPIENRVRYFKLDSNSSKTCSTKGTWKENDTITSVINFVLLPNSS